MTDVIAELALAWEAPAGAWTLGEPGEIRLRLSAPGTTPAADVRIEVSPPIEVPTRLKDDFRVYEQEVVLTLAGLGPHTAVSVAFDLYVAGSWDGNSPSEGPDVWSLRVGDGAVLFQTRFNTQPHSLVDRGFVLAAALPETATCLAVQPDGGVLVGGGTVAGAQGEARPVSAPRRRHRRSAIRRRNRRGWKRQECHHGIGRPDLHCRRPLEP